MKVRYGHSLPCPRCAREAMFYRRVKRPAYTCEFCGFDINPMAGTLFHRSRTALRKWFYAIFLFASSRHGVPARELQRQLGVTLKTAWRMGHEIRKYIGAVDGDDDLGGHVEVDETMIGGKRKGGKRGRGAPGKTVVPGMLERAGNVMTRVVGNVRRTTLEAVILEKIKRGTTISTDEFQSYAKLACHGYRHGTVNHSLNEFARGPIHVNSLEGFWSQLKRSIRGTHVHVSARHLGEYLGEFKFRYNPRKAPHLMFPRLVLSF